MKIAERKYSISFGICFCGSKPTECVCTNWWTRGCNSKWIRSRVIMYIRSLDYGGMHDWLAVDSDEARPSQTQTHIHPCHWRCGHFDSDRCVPVLCSLLLCWLIAFNALAFNQRYDVMQIINEEFKWIESYSLILFNIIMMSVQLTVTYKLNTETTTKTFSPNAKRMAALPSQHT